MNLKRGDKQYIEVEKFEDYEWFTCLSYEMAIRNDRVVTLMKNKLLDKSTNEEESELNNTYGLFDEYYTEYHLYEKENRIFCAAVEHRYTPPSCLKDGFTHDISTEGEGDDEYISYNSIQWDFKRPMLFHKETFDLVTQVSINFNLPEEELIAYVKHIKKYFDSREIEKTPYLDFVYKDDRTKEKDRILKNKQKMADLFFVYDCTQLGYSKRKIQNLFYNYYADKGIETKTLDYHTIKSYLEIATNYIDNLQYMELITGRSQSLIN